MLKEVDIYIWTHFGTQLRQIIALVSATWDRLFTKNPNACLKTKFFYLKKTQKIVLLTIPEMTEGVYFEKVESYEFWWTIETTLNN